jgi:hypothetical protein
MSRGQLHKCTVPLTDRKFPLRVVMLSTLYGLYHRLEGTVHFDSSKRPVCVVVRVKRVTKFSTWGGIKL